MHKMQGQMVTNYNFSSSASTYSAITGGTVLGSNFNDDDIFDNINIGFTFNFGGTNYTQLSVCANGYIKPGVGIFNPAYYSPISDVFGDDTIISALGADIQSNFTGVLQYQTIGIAPNRVFITQWTDYTSYGNNDNFGFQIRLHETTNVIEMFYDAFTMDVNGTYEVGLRGILLNNDFNNRSVVNFSNTWATSIAGISSSDYCELDPGPPAFIPISGQKYVWSTAACTAPNVTLAASQSTVCANVPVTLTALGATNYSWSTSTSTSTISVTPSVTTTYTVTGDNGPSCTDTKTITITIKPSPVITFSASPSVSLCPGGSALITASGASNYTWSVGSQTTAAISVTPGISQAYNVVGTNSLGCSTSSNITIFVVFCTGVNGQVATTSDVKLFPNPTNGEFTIELPNGYNKAIQVLDVTGRLVLVNNTAEDKINLNLANLSNGIYYVKVVSNNSTEVLKVIKE